MNMSLPFDLHTAGHLAVDRLTGHDRKLCKYWRST